MNNKVTKRDTLLNAMWYPELNYQKRHNGRLE